MKKRPLEETTYVTLTSGGQPLSIIIQVTPLLSGGYRAGARMRAWSQALSLIPSRHYEGSREEVLREIKAEVEELLSTFINHPNWKGV